MPDHILRVGRSKIQHGPLNDRVYLISCDPADLPDLVDVMEELAAENGYSKISAKVPASAEALFRSRGYQVEARIPELFQGVMDAIFCARFPDPARAEMTDAGTIREVLSVAKAKGEESAPCPLPGGLVIEEAGPADAERVADLFGEVFETYPFPVGTPRFLEEMMHEDTRYFFVASGERVIAASAAEMDPATKSVEMTDFATHPAYRGMGLCTQLLRRMEKEMAASGFLTAYTIARAAFYPINITFAKSGYWYGGTLCNNTQICGSFESMNVWYRPLGPG
ncbi:MAG: putative beta-lysine N-acetyltransferase [Methanomicrobiaceae archaeon]|nr:putative beta-lysine N-acetyltransferase [Methanomicrobiaceae archaeon]